MEKLFLLSVAVAVLRASAAADLSLNFDEEITLNDTNGHNYHDIADNNTNDGDYFDDYNYEGDNTSFLAGGPYGIEDLPDYDCTREHSCLSSSYSRTCSCDAECVIYNDCCVDANYSSVQKEEEQEKFQCVERGGSGFYMITSCPSEWQVSEVTAICTSANATRSYSLESFRDPVAHLPVTSTTTNITYANYNCAICNNDSQDLYVWRPLLTCNIPFQLPQNVTQDYIKSNMVYQGGKWGIILNQTAIETFYGCLIFPESYTNARICPLNMINSCALNWTDSATEHLCRSYQGLVYNIRPDSKSYKNQHCALCNHVQSICYDFNVKYASPAGKLPAFSMLLDFTDPSGSNSVGSVSSWNSNEIFDPFSSKYRNIVCEEHSQIQLESGLCSKINSTTGNYTSVEQRNGTCIMTIFDKDEYVILTNNSVYVEEYDKIYEEGEYEVNETGRVLVCLPNSSSKFSAILGWVTFVGLGLSCLCLILHLFAFTLVPHLRNLPGKNLAAFSVCLLVAYCSFIIGVFVQPYSTQCYIFAAIMYFSFMASFSWMNIMAFDIWQTFRRSTRNLQVTSGEQWCKFFAYSSYGWCLPSLALIVVVTIDKVKPHGFPSEFLPSLGEDSCWFGKRKALLVFFAVPLFSVLALNIILFAATVTYISKSKMSTTATTSVAHHKKQFLLYVRLASIMGFTWLSGVLAALLQVEALWYIFVVLNTFQGAFVFLAFTCRRRVFKELLHKCHKWLLVSRISGRLRGSKGISEGHSPKSNHPVNDLTNSSSYSSGSNVDQIANSTETSTTSLNTKF